MNKEFFISELEKLIQQGEQQPPYTVDTPKSASELCALFSNIETATDAIQVVHGHMRELLTAAKQPLIAFLAQQFNSDLLSEVNIWINPQEPPIFKTNDYKPYLLVSDQSLHLEIETAPMDLTVYADPSVNIQLSNGGAIFSGKSVCMVSEGSKYETTDFATLVAAKQAKCFCDDYSICFAAEGSEVKASKYSCVIKTSPKAEIHTYQSARLIIQTPKADFSMHKHFRPFIKTEPKPQVAYAYTNPVQPESQQSLRLDTKLELLLFQKALVFSPSERPCLPSAQKCNNCSLWELIDRIDSALQSKDTELSNELEGIADKEQLTKILATHFDILRPSLGIDFIRQQFDPELLAEYQIYVNDRTMVNPCKLSGVFYVFGNQIVDQPAGCIGHYFDNTIGHVENGTAYFYDDSVGIGRQAMIYGLDHSLIYGHNVTARLSNHATGSFHGESIIDTSLYSSAYLYDQTLANCYQQSNLVLFDDAKVGNAHGGIIYGDAQAVLQHSDETVIYSQPDQLQQIRMSGVLPNQTNERNHILR